MYFQAIIAIAFSLIAIAAGAHVKLRASENEPCCKKASKFLGAFIVLVGVILFAASVYFTFTTDFRREGPGKKGKYDVQLSPGGMQPGGMPMMMPKKMPPPGMGKTPDNVQPKEDGGVE